MVWPISRTARRMNERISAPVCESRLPVGSSAKMMSGRLASARATATRCCWPPESSDGRWLSRLPRPTVSITDCEPLAVRLATGERQRQRDVLDRGERRHEVERLEDEADAVAAQLGELAVVERAEVGVADEHLAAASGCRGRRRQCISVDLPEPDGPMIAVNWRRREARRRRRRGRGPRCRPARRPWWPGRHRRRERRSGRPVRPGGGVVVQPNMVGCSWKVEWPGSGSTTRCASPARGGIARQVASSVAARLISRQSHCGPRTTGDVRGDGRRG